MAENIFQFKEAHCVLKWGGFRQGDGGVNETGLHKRWSQVRLRGWLSLEGVNEGGMPARSQIGDTPSIKPSISYCPVFPP